MYRIAAAGDINVFSPASLAGYVATAIVTVIGFLITVLILKKLLYKPLMTMVKKRQDKADTLLEEAAQKAAAADGRQKEIETEADAIIKQATERSLALKNEGEQTAASIVAKAKEEAEAIRAKAQADDRQRRAEAEEQVYHQAVDLAMLAVGNFLTAENRERQLGEYEEVRSILSDLVKAEQEQLKEPSRKHEE